jgi:hypothetical protein
MVPDSMHPKIRINFPTVINNYENTTDPPEQQEEHVT